MDTPWYVVAWRAVWLVPVQCCRVLLTTCALCGWGRRTAERVWRDTR